MQQKIRSCMNRAENRYEIATRALLNPQYGLSPNYRAKEALRRWRDSWIEYLQGEYKRHGI